MVEAFVFLHEQLIIQQLELREFQGLSHNILSLAFLNRICKVHSTRFLVFQNHKRTFLLRLTYV